MKMPGFVAEASLIRAESGNRTTSSARARSSFCATDAISPQLALRVDALPRFFHDSCHERCLAAQQRAALDCLGRCARFVGGTSPLFSACVSTCGRGEDFYREVFIENESNILRAAPELKSGYCDYRCLRPRLTPNYFSR